MKFTKIMDGIMESTGFVKDTFLIMTVLVVYVEFIFPKLTFSKWIITPIFILAMIGWLWRFMRGAFIKEKKQETKNEIN